MQSQKLVSFLFIYLIMVKMQSQKLVSFFIYLFNYGKNAVAKARVILCLFIKNLLQIYELIFI